MKSGNPQGCLTALFLTPVAFDALIADLRQIYTDIKSGDSFHRALPFDTFPTNQALGGISPHLKRGDF
jgi:hypothetical protein